MRPLDQDAGAPVSAMTEASGFWDHLGATRGDEYAQDAILPHVPDLIFTPPALAQEPQMPAAPKFTAADFRQGSLDDTLQALDRAVALRDEASEGPQPLTSALAMGARAGQMPDAEAFTAPAQFMSAEARGSVRRKPRRDSRLRYRLQRLWLTPFYRRMIKVGLPLGMVAAALTAFFADEANRAAITAQGEALYSAVVDRPEFMITTLDWPDVNPALDHALRGLLEIELPRSSFRLDLDALRAEVEALDWVRSADLRLRGEGVLALSVIERTPSVLWRAPQGLALLDAEGVRVAYVVSRDIRPDLPLIAGEGADAHVGEALNLLDAASPLGARVLGLERMGARRWDVVLDRGQRIKLPEKGALAALERVIALEEAQDMLSRDVEIADLRNPARPILRLSPDAMDTLREIRASSLENR